MTKDDFTLALEKLNIKFTERQLDQLEQYYTLLIEYNKVMNLTGIIDKNDVYLKHFYDSLTICEVIDLNEVESLCDIGSGAGFPGLVLKIFFPHLKICLVDSLQKRINFLNIVIDKLKLNGIEAIHERIEDYAKEKREMFDVVTARAVASTNILLELASPLVKLNGFFIPLKGTLLTEPKFNNAMAKLNMDLIVIKEFKLPVENSSRSILLFKKMNLTNKKFPRKYSEIKRNPL